MNAWMDRLTEEEKRKAGLLPEQIRARHAKTLDVLTRHDAGKTAEGRELIQALTEYLEDEPEDHTDDMCPCGDPDCSRPFGHHEEN